MHQNPDQMLRLPKTSDVLRSLQERLFSGHDAQAIGYADELATEVLYTDQAKRLNMHILGAPGQGKSKFLELLAEWNIGREAICLIDSTENGNTATNLLKHCYLKGYEKVCVIDPSDFETYKAVPILKPLKLKEDPQISINNISDILRVLWDSTFEQTRRVERYVPAVIRALWEAKLTLAELLFLLYPQYEAERALILNDFKAKRDPAYMTLINAYGKQYDIHFLPSVNTLTPFIEPHLRLLVGSHRQGIPWSRFIKERWVVLVNLNPRGAWGDNEKARKLLGTLIISEIVHALSRMVNRGWKSPFSMYIDEVGHYATPKLGNILDHQRHLNLRLTLAHQHLRQITNDAVLASILTSAQNKALFYTSNHADRLLMMQTMGYGADLPDRMVLFNLAQLEKQKVAIRLGREHPVYMRIKHIPDPDVPQADFKRFKQKIYAQPWYASPDEINSEINARFPEDKFTSTITLRPKSSSTKKTSANPKPYGKGTFQTRRKSNVPRENSRSAPDGAVPNDQSHSQSVLFTKKRRSTSEVIPNSPKKE